MRPTGLFWTHVRSPRVERAYARLVAETDGLVDWHLVHNASPGARPETDLRAPDPAELMPARHAQLLVNGGVQYGYLDVALLPCVVAAPSEHVWVVEYDVDYAGHWSTFFSDLAGDDADLLTTTVRTRAEVPGWDHWRRATAPAWVDEADWTRAFHPVLRLSQRFARAYALMMADRDWRGHYEFTLPTAARVGGFALADLGSTGWATPPARAGRHYRNTPETKELTPGTFVWRPSRPRYFHEAPEDFDERDLLHHPVKPDVREWRWNDRNRPVE